MVLPILRWTVFIGLVALGFLVSPAGVSAHADYESSQPDRNEVLPEPPTRVDVWFTQELFKRQGRNFVRVFDEQDQQVSEGDGIVDDDDRTHMYTTLPSGLPEGRYIVRWMSTSDEDGDTDEGAFCFYVGVEPTAEQAAECAVFDEDVPERPTAPPATPTEPEAAASPTEVAAAATPTARSAADEAGGGDDGGVSTVVIVVAAIAGVAALVVVVGAAAVWLRRTLM